MLLRRVHGAVGVGGRRPVRPPRGLRRLQRPHALLQGRPPVLHLPGALPRRARHKGRRRRRQQAAAGRLSRPSPTFFGDGGAGPGRVAMNGDYWYHKGMAAYFDDREQYEAVRKMCLAKPSRPQQQQ
ncbi:hypothetical protein ACP70R_045813 [Stipagrostis hirtigluma subsp. patula]